MTRKSHSQYSAADVAEMVSERIEAHYGDLAPEVKAQIFRAEYASSLRRFGIKA